MSERFQKGRRDIYGKDAVRFRDQGRPPQAPQRDHFWMYWRNGIPYYMDDQGVEHPFGATEVVFGEPSNEVLCCGILDPVITTNNIPKIAYSEPLLDDHTYFFTTRIVIRQQSGGSGHGQIQVSACMKREGGGIAVVVGDIFQELKNMTDDDWDATWAVSGNDARLIITGGLGITLEWQPTLKREVVS